ncbi:MAG: hypothetical protein M1813_005457 [Trichoglossum hirsutum]|nr:MAG: hypothetical protein M1813_005457 [Trichoglossum hirsutum]
MPVGARLVDKSIREINDNSWAIGDRILLLSRQRSPSSDSTWSDGKGSFYVISGAPHPLPPSRPYCQPRPTSRWSMTLVGYQLSGASATTPSRSKSWIRVSSEMDLPMLGGDRESRVDWRRRAPRQLGKEGLPEICENAHKTEKGRNKGGKLSATLSDIMH